MTAKVTPKQADDIHLDLLSKLALISVDTISDNDLDIIFSLIATGLYGSDECPPMYTITGDD